MKDTLLTKIQNENLPEEALPYIEMLQSKTVVIKYGGNAMLNETLKKAVMKDITLLSRIGIKIVLVHGGGPEITGMLKRIGKESRFINGLRYTDGETIEIAAMVLAGKVNKGLVAMIQANNGNAVGLCGLDGGMLQVEKLEGEIDLGFVGDIKKVVATCITMSLESGFIPVIATIGADKNGQIYNINADTAAAAIASELNAERLISMTDIRGLLRDINDENSLIAKAGTGEIPGLIEAGIISGGMIPKIQCCVDGINNGIKEVAIIDGRVEHAILTQLLSDEEIGTRIYQS